MPNYYTVVGLGFSDCENYDWIKDRNLCEDVMPIPKNLSIREQDIWTNDNWGAKWGAQHTKITELSGDSSPIILEFICAWNAPSSEILNKITEYLKSKDIFIKHWCGLDPCDNSYEDLNNAV